jgi:hypothetical protein
MHESWEDIISKGEQWAKINIDRTILSYIEKDSSEKSQTYKYSSIGDQTAELDIHPADPVSTKTV